VYGIDCCQVEKEVLVRFDFRMLDSLHLPDLMRFHDSNISLISRELAVSRQTIRKWCKEDGIDVEGYRDP